MTTVNDLLGNKGQDIWVTHPDATIREALELMKEHNIGALPVVQDESYNFV